MYKITISDTQGTWHDTIETDNIIKSLSDFFKYVPDPAYLDLIITITTEE